MMSEELLHAGLETSFGAGDGDWSWLFRGDRERFTTLGLRSSVLPLVDISGSLSSSFDLNTGRFFGFLAWLILVVGLVTQMTLRQVER